MKKLNCKKYVQKYTKKILTLHCRFCAGGGKHAKCAGHEVLEEHVRLGVAAALVLAKVGHLGRRLIRRLVEGRLDPRRQSAVTQGAVALSSPLRQRGRD